MDFALLKKPLGWLPIVAAFGALTLPWVAVLVFGPDPKGDEGAAAHLWQLFMGLQVILIIVFAAVYLPQKPKQAFYVLLVQIAFMVAADLPVFLLKL